MIQKKHVQGKDLQERERERKGEAETGRQKEGGNELSHFFLVRLTFLEVQNSSFICSR